MTTRRTLFSAVIVLTQLALSWPAQAQADPAVLTADGLIVTTFPIAGGRVTAYIPDDVAPGERFSGTLEGPRGFALMLGNQRARTGETFQWSVPAGAANPPLALVLVDARGKVAGRVPFRTQEKSPQEPGFRFPRLIESGRPFPIRGVFDGNARTTKVTIARKAAPPLAESLRKSVVRAPTGVLGRADCTLTESGTDYRQTSRSLAVKLSGPGADAGERKRELTVQGLAGIEQDVPLLIGDSYFYLSAAEIPSDGTFSTRSEFRGTSASLVIPQSRRDEVVLVLRTPQRDSNTSLARQHGDELRALGFDALPIASELFTDFTLGGDAASAILALDERRALSLIFSSIPRSDLEIQRVGFMWFLTHLQSAGSLAGEAHAAALRVLARILSTATAQLALGVVGVTGSEADFPLLERLFQGTPGLRDATEAALVRLGSLPHLESVRAELTAPLTPDTTYREGLRLAQVMRIAAFSGQTALVPAVCGHVSDPVLVEVDVSVDLSDSAANALTEIVDGTAAPQRPRTLDDWKTYCREMVR